MVAEITRAWPADVTVTGDGVVATGAGADGVPLMVRLYSPNGTLTLTGGVGRRARSGSGQVAQRRSAHRVEVGADLVQAQSVGTKTGLGVTISGLT